MEYLYANWEMLLIAFVLIVASSCLNRLRGTGLLYYFGTIKNLEKYTFNKVDKLEVKVVWNHIYGLFLAFIFGILTNSYGIGFLTLVAYLIGESKGWGEWVGGLVSTKKERDEQWLEARYIDEEGKGFPFIFAITNFFIKEKNESIWNHEMQLKHYFKHITLALILRGIYWWTLVYAALFYYKYINLIEYLTISISLGLLFPIACYLGNKLNINKKFGVLNLSVGWENQELFYGIFHGIALSYIVLHILNYI